MYLGAIEAGGTKFVCAVSNEQLEIVDQVCIPTTTPQETLRKVFSFFNQYELRSMGIGSFGPIDINIQSATYGFITSTPKPGWRNFDFLGTIKKHYQVPVAWTTDVNAAAYGEYKKGSARDDASCLYLTVGTGIGGGAVIDGKLLEAFGHPEMGHVLVRTHEEDTFQGSCPYHGNCLEGMASGPAIEGRTGRKAQSLKKEDSVWEMEAYYLAQALNNYTLILRPDKIILGGGVMNQIHLFPLIRTAFEELNNAYVPVPVLEQYIVAPGLGDHAGITGCLLLASTLEVEKES
ncbi:ROK family protein [Sediminibacillus dalangtanensis]|uniref:fructokinase n=1 Tax=Sediminibacillus dalangtanensis TaxID=2729421 RepID=A0ABX7W276_9BACI|nr:ROK family protein [Sediminibacillus dalangtanensis]QTN01398.1 ROK family protein [Sediminibacillus dalangtanensis]